MAGSRIAGWLAPDRDPLRRKQLEPPVRADGKCLNVEIGGDVVGGAPDRRGPRDDQKPGALPDPVDMPVTVHESRAAPERAQPADEPAAVDERGADALGKRFRRAGIFDGMMMERYQPAGARVLRHGDL